MRYSVSLPPAKPRKITEIPVWGTEPTPIATPFCPVTALRQRLEQLPTNQLEIALRLAQEHLQASGTRLYIQTEQAIYHCGLQPKKLGDHSHRLVEQHLLWQRFLLSGYTHQAGDTELSSDRTWVIANLSSEFRLRTLATAFEPQEIEQVMVIPLRYGGQMIGCFSVFRDRTLPPWTLAEVVLAQKFSSEFAQAIYDHQLVHQISQAIKARTAGLAQDDLKQIISGMIKVSLSQSVSQTPAALCGVSSRA